MFGYNFKNKWQKVRIRRRATTAFQGAGIGTRPRSYVGPMIDLDLWDGGYKL